MSHPACVEDLGKNTRAEKGPKLDSKLNKRKIRQKLCNILFFGRHNLAVPSVTKYTWLWDVELTWYSPSVTLHIYVPYPWYGYVKRTYNVHKMFIYNIGIPKHKNTYDFWVQVRNFFITFELKGFSP